MIGDQRNTLRHDLFFVLFLILLKDKEFEFKVVT